MSTSSFRFWPALTGVVVGVFGLAYLILGAWLAISGGTPWYLLFGGGFLISGIALFRRRQTGIWLYLVTFLMCVTWALTEVGLDGWQLMPRLLAPAVLGVWLSLPWVVRPIVAAPSRRRSAAVGGVIYVIAIAGIMYSGWQVTDARFVQHQPFLRCKPLHNRPLLQRRMSGNIMAATRQVSVFPL